MTTPVLDHAYFLELFDEFKTVPQAKISAFINMAGRLVSPRMWGEFTQDAMAYMTAHLLTSTNGVGGQAGYGAGPIVSDSAGSISTSYGTVGTPGIDDDLNSTVYGRRFIALRKIAIIPGMTTGGHQMGVGWPNNDDDDQFALNVNGGQNWYGRHNYGGQP